jgi:hypothetical protein
MSDQTTATEKGRVEQSEVLEDVTLKIAKLNAEWKKYNLYSGQLVLKDSDGYKLSNNKIVFRDLPTQQSPTINLIQVLGSEYRVYANEEVEKGADQWASENGFKPYDKYTHISKSGNAIFRTYLPNDEYRGSYNITDKDSVKLGFCVRNSIDGTVGFGLDTFTYRGVCANGSIMGRANEAGVYHKHTMGLTDIINSFKVYVDEAMKAGEQVISYYRLLVTIPLDEKLARVLTKTPIPKKYLPFSLNTDKLPVLPTKTMNMWEVYNTLTQNIWHSDRTDIRSKYLYFNHLHSALINAIPMPMPVTGV